MELRELRSFLAVVRTGSVTRAADELHITQPALSRQIAGLERDLGCSLLDRGRHGAIPTEEGLLLARRAEALLELAGKTEEELRASEGRLEGTVSICCGQTAALDELAHLAAAFTERHPHIRISLVVTTSEASLRRLREGRADLAVLLDPFEPADLDFLRLGTQEQWVAVMRQDDPLSGKEAITARDLTKGALILPHRAGPQSVLASWFGRSFSRLEVAGTANLNVAADALVRAGIGRSLQVAMKHTVDDLTRVPLDPPLVTGSCLVWLRGKPMSRAAAAFVDYARIRLASDS
ncbi:MAG: LysR family transcriptional regulator [Atopobiaceae bacterium]|nr:LysR family transcriptional regulator [Atopobiaceae bacterium]